MLTCLCDAFYGEVGIATARVLEHVGCEVEFPDEQTCCGQPPFNAGDWGACRTLAKRTAGVFKGSTVVVPSASCTAMVRHGYGMVLGQAPFECFELCEFLVRHVGLSRWPPERSRPIRGRSIAFHTACHGRAIGLGSLQKEFVSTIRDLEIVEFAEDEQCCGFGGAFSATHGAISSGIGLQKLEMIASSGATEIIGGDMGCLMHLDGLIRRHELPLKVRHVSQLLAEAIP